MTKIYKLNNKIPVSYEISAEESPVQIGQRKRFGFGVSAEIVIILVARQFYFLRKGTISGVLGAGAI